MKKLFTVLLALVTFTTLLFAQSFFSQKSDLYSFESSVQMLEFNTLDSSFAETVEGDFIKRVHVEESFQDIILKKVGDVFVEIQVSNAEFTNFFQNFDFNAVFSVFSLFGKDKVTEGASNTYNFIETINILAFASLLFYRKESREKERSFLHAKALAQNYEGGVYTLSDQKRSLFS